jgi:hypothetical protein
MAEGTLYLRNLRPNRVILKYAGLREVLERRGAREDTTSLPAEARNEPLIARWLRAGMIEEISKEDFLELAASGDLFDPQNRSEDEPKLKNTVRDPRVPQVPMAHDNSATPTVIDTDKIDKKLLSPQVEWATVPEPTNLAPAAVSVSDLHKGGVTGRADNLGEDVEEEETPAPKPKRKPAPRKKPAPKK